MSKRTTPRRQAKAPNPARIVATPPSPPLAVYTINSFGRDRVPIRVGDIVIEVDGGEQGGRVIAVAGQAVIWIDRDGDYGFNAAGNLKVLLRNHTDRSSSKSSTAADAVPNQPVVPSGRRDQVDDATAADLHRRFEDVRERMHVVAMLLSGLIDCGDGMDWVDPVAARQIVQASSKLVQEMSDFSIGIHSQRGMNPALAIEAEFRAAANERRATESR